MVNDFGSKIIFMPDATRGAVRYLTTLQVEETGTNNIVVNTLHLMISPGAEKIQALGGIKKFMNFSGTVLSDSGGFQVFSLLHTKKWKGKITKDGATFQSPKDGKTFELTPEKSIDIQMMLDTDVMVVLDDCRNAEISRKEAEISVDRTIEWAKRAKKHFEKLEGHKKGKLLSCVIQGASFLDLREFCAKELSKLSFDGYNFGGYVARENGKLVLDEMKVVIENTPKDRFKYAMGVGKPEDIIAASKLGYTVFDTVLPSRNARHGTVYSFDEKDYVLRITSAQYSEDIKPIDSTCDCYTCRNHTRAYVHHLIRNDESTGKQLATIHNLRFYQRLVEKLNKGEL
jgi:queuine tRNA-ribosyltransferase